MGNTPSYNEIRWTLVMLLSSIQGMCYKNLASKSISLDDMGVEEASHFNRIVGKGVLCWL